MDGPQVKNVTTDGALGRKASYLRLMVL